MFFKSTNISNPKTPKNLTIYFQPQPQPQPPSPQPPPPHLRDKMSIASILSNNAKYAYMALNIAASCLMPVFAKITAKKYNPINNVVISAVCFLFFSIVYLYFENKRDPQYLTQFHFDSSSNNPNSNLLDVTPDLWQNLSNPRIILFSMASGVRFFAAFVANSCLPITISIPLTALTTYATLFFYHILEKHIVTDLDLIAVSISFFGIIVMSWEKIRGHMEELAKEKKLHKKHKDNGIVSFEVAIALLITAILLNGLLSVMNHQVVNMTSPGMAMINESVGACFLTVFAWAVYTYFPMGKWPENKLPSGLDVLKAVGVYFLFVMAGILSKFKALSMLSPTVVSTLSNTNIIFSLLLGSIFFGERITVMKVCGAIILFLSVIVISFQDSVHSWTSILYKFVTQFF